MRTLIVYTNRSRNPMPVMPLGACIVAEAAAAAGHEVRLLDFMFERRPLAALKRALLRFRPGAVGISFRNIDNNDLAKPVGYHRDLPAIVNLVHDVAGVPVVLGGAAMGVMPGPLLRFSGADWGVPRDGESIFPALLGAFEQNRDPRELPGMAWLENGRLRLSAGYALNSGFRCVAPDYRRWTRLGPYNATLAAAGLQTKRGCPHKCVYCTYAMMEGPSYALAEPQSVVQAVGRLGAMGIRDVEFVDNVFNSPYDHAMDVCHALARARTGARLHTIELNPRYTDAALLEAMADAGFAGAGITAESASDAVLDGLGKGYTSGDVFRAADAVRRSRTPAMWIFLLGGPGETDETVRETLRFAAAVVRPFDAAFFNVGLRIYPGTELERIARSEGVLTASEDEMLEPVHYFSPRVARADVEAMLDGAVRRHLNLIGPASINYRWMELVTRVARRFGAMPPLWRYVRPVRQAMRFLGMDPV